MNLFAKLQFILKKPKVVIVSGRAKDKAREAVLRVLTPHFQLGKDVLVIEDSGNKQELLFLIKNSRLAVLVVSHTGEIDPEKEFFSGQPEEVLVASQLAESLSASSFLLLNSDNETVWTLKDKSRARVLTFGLAARADLRASDISETEAGTNFKIDYEGNIVPVWLDKLFGKENIYAALAGAAAGEALDLNLIEISQALKG